MTTFEVLSDQPGAAASQPGRLVAWLGLGLSGSASGSAAFATADAASAPSTTGCSATSALPAARQRPSPAELNRVNRQSNRE